MLHVTNIFLNTHNQLEPSTGSNTAPAVTIYLNFKYKNVLPEWPIFKVSHSGWTSWYETRLHGFLYTLINPQQAWQTYWNYVHCIFKHSTSPLGHVCLDTFVASCSPTLLIPNHSRYKSPCTAHIAFLDRVSHLKVKRERIHRLPKGRTQNGSLTNGRFWKKDW